MRVCIGTFYYEQLHEISNIPLNMLVGSAGNQGAADTEPGQALHREQMPTIVCHASSAMLSMRENDAMEYIYYGMVRFRDILPKQSLGKLLLDHGEKVQFSDFVGALVDVPETVHAEAEDIFGVLAHAVYLLVFKAQKIDACAAHHKGPAQAAIVDSFAIAIFEGCLALRELTDDMYTNLQRLLRSSSAT